MWNSKQVLSHRAEQRFAVFRRDVGICRRCGLDTIALKQALRQIEIRCTEIRPAEHKDYIPFVEGSGVSWIPYKFGDLKLALWTHAWRYPKALWDANMIIPRSRGGRETLENFESLCLACHRIETNRVIYGPSYEALT